VVTYQQHRLPPVGKRPLNRHPSKMAFQQPAGVVLEEGVDEEVVFRSEHRAVIGCYFLFLRVSFDVI